jgi:hypothetical protein
VTLFSTSNARGYAAADATRLDRLYAETREQEWSEFRADCGKYLAELNQERRSASSPSRSSRRESRAWTGCAAGTGTDAREISSPVLPLPTPSATSSCASSSLRPNAEHVYSAVGSRPQD